MAGEIARCSRRYCGALLHPVTDGNGRAALVCFACERNRRGLCRDCGGSLHATNRRNAMRCTRCAKRRALALARAYDRSRYARRQKQALAWMRTYQAQPDIREHRRQYMRAYREREGRDDQSRAYQRAYMAQRRADAGYRAKQNARKRELRALRREQSTTVAAS